MRSKFYMTASPKACRSISFLDFIAPYWYSGSSWSFLVLCAWVSHHFHVSSDLISLLSACSNCFFYIALSCLFAYIFVCYHLSCSPSATSSLPFFLSLCQCFSSCQSFTLSVSPFVTFSVALRSSLAYGILCARVCPCMGMLQQSFLGFHVSMSGSFPFQT